MLYHRFFLSFFRHLLSELAERNLTKTGHILERVYLPLQIGGSKQCISTTLQRNGKPNGLYLQTETWYT